jgi:hypothetical protein
VTRWHGDRTNRGGGGGHEETRLREKSEKERGRGRRTPSEREDLEGHGIAARHTRTRLCVSRCDDAWTRVYQERSTLAWRGSADCGTRCSLLRISSRRREIAAADLCFATSAPRRQRDDDDEGDGFPSKTGRRSFLSRHFLSARVRAIRHDRTTRVVDSAPRFAKKAARLIRRTKRSPRSRKRFSPGGKISASADQRSRC